jgi:hypothetical protein
VWEAVKKRDRWKELPFREDLVVEAEESPLLEVITREWLVRHSCGD